MADTASASAGMKSQVTGRLKYLAVLLAITLCAGCTPKIPNKVSTDEYAIYSAWTAHFYAKHPPAKLYIVNRTLVFDPLAPNGFGKVMHDHAKVPWSIIKELHELGEAEYPLDIMPPGRNLNIPWQYDVAESWLPCSPQHTCEELSFSRVAFNRAHDEALFEFVHGGGGGAILRPQEKWNLGISKCRCSNF